MVTEKKKKKATAGLDSKKKEVVWERRILRQVRKCLWRIVRNMKIMEVFHFHLTALKRGNSESHQHSEAPVDISLLSMKGWLYLEHSPTIWISPVNLHDPEKRTGKSKINIKPDSVSWHKFQVNEAWANEVSCPKVSLNPCHWCWWYLPWRDLFLGPSQPHEAML